MNEISDISVIKGFIETYSLALTALAFIVYTVCVRKITAFNLVLLGLIVLNIMHAHIARNLIPLFGVKELEDLVSYAWYLSFGLTDVVFIIVCCLIISRYELIKDRITSAILVVIGFLASLQFTDLILTRFDFSFFADIYTNGVVFGNITMTILPFLMLLRVILIRFGVVQLKWIGA